MTISKQGNECLRLCVKHYIRQIPFLSYAKLRSIQDPPWATLACGAAGIAAALVHTKQRRRDALEMASRWVGAAARDVRPFACWSPEPGAEQARSLHYSGDGIQLARNLVDHARGNASKRARSAWYRRCLTTAGGSVELLQGSAGYLTALVLFHRRTGDGHALSAADCLAGDTLERLPQWTRASSPFFAHGRAGTFHALLLWSLAGERELPPAFFDALHALANEVAASPAPSHAMHLSWCNGVAGLVLLWAKAYERTRDARHLRWARQGGRLLHRLTQDAAGDLCCGFAGRAYALLALERVDPDGDWLTRAEALGERAAGAMLENAGAWPNGLYKGYPGLVCLAHDLSRARKARKVGANHDARTGFPLIEA